MVLKVLVVGGGGREHAIAAALALHLIVNGLGHPKEKRK
jgi:phosphoribosylamine-glycine ligase